MRIFAVTCIFIAEWRDDSTQKDSWTWIRVEGVEGVERVEQVEVVPFSSLGRSGTRLFWKYASPASTASTAKTCHQSLLDDYQTTHLGV